MSTSTVSVVDRELQVGASGRIFPEERWREAILYYLFGVWSGDESVTGRPKIIFGEVTLRLDPQRCEHFVYGKGSDYDFATATGPGEHLVVDPAQKDVELGLVRFVKDDRIKKLSIAWSTTVRLSLYKTKRRGQYRCATWCGVPLTWEGLGPSLR